MAWQRKRCWIATERRCYYYTIKLHKTSFKSCGDREYHIAEGDSNMRPEVSSLAKFA